MCGYFYVFTFFFYKGDLIIKELLINEQITSSEVRLVGDAGEQLGVMSVQSALDIAREKDLDLVEVSPNAKPSVCKIMDYGKYRFDQMKKEKEARKKNKAQETKGIRLSLTISDYDIAYRVKNAKDFLQEGNKVKLSIKLNGRQQAYPEQGIEIMKKFASMVGEVGVIEKAPSLEGRYINMVLSPKK